MANPKCKQCGKVILDKSSAYIYQKTDTSPKLYFCDEQECDIYIAENNRIKLETKRKYKPSKTKVDGTVNPRRKLSDAIQLIYFQNGYSNSNIPWTLIMSTIKNIMDNYKDYQDKPYSYGGIQYCLSYMQDIEEINLFDEKSNTILALVPFNYDKSKKYWYQCQEIKKSVANFEFNDDVIVIKKSSNDENRCFKEIDMENL